MVIFYLIKSFCGTSQLNVKSHKFFMTRLAVEALSLPFCAYWVKSEGSKGIKGIFLSIPFINIERYKSPF